MNDSNFNEPTNKELLLHAWGGLGGQLLALSYAIWISKHHERAVKLVFHDGGASLRPLELSDVLASDFIQNMNISYTRVHDFTSSRTADSVFGKVSSKIKSKLKAIKAFVLRKFNINQKTFILPDITMAELLHLSEDTQELNGYSTDYSVFEEVQSEICAALEYSNQPNFLANGGQENTLSIHWRLGDYLNNPFHGTVSFTSISEAIKSLELPLETPITLFTDSPDIAEKYIRESDFDRHIEIKSSTIWNDMFQMSRSKFFIGNHSAVSMLASLSIFSGNSKSRILVPTKWFANNEDSFRFHPPLIFSEFQKF